MSKYIIDETVLGTIHIPEHARWRKNPDQVDGQIVSVPESIEVSYQLDSQTIEIEWNLQAAQALADAICKLTTPTHNIFGRRQREEIIGYTGPKETFKHWGKDQSFTLEDRVLVVFEEVPIEKELPTAYVLVAREGYLYRIEGETANVTFKVPRRNIMERYIWSRNTGKPFRIGPSRPMRPCTPERSQTILEKTYTVMMNEGEI